MQFFSPLPGPRDSEKTRRPLGKTRNRLSTSPRYFHCMRNSFEYRAAFASDRMARRRVGVQVSHLTCRSKETLFLSEYPNFCIASRVSIPFPINFDHCFPNERTNDSFFLSNRNRKKNVRKSDFTQHRDRAGDQHGEQPHSRYLEADHPFGGRVPRPQRIPDAEIPAQRDEAHVHYARGTSQHVARHVHVTPHHPEWPVSCNIQHGVLSSQAIFH